MRIWWNGVGCLMSLVTWQTPFGVQCSKPYGERTKCASLMGRDGRDGRDGTDGRTGRSPKVSFNFLYFKILINIIPIWTQWAGSGPRQSIFTKSAINYFFFVHFALFSKALKFPLFWFRGVRSWIFVFSGVKKENVEKFRNQEVVLKRSVHHPKNSF